MALVSEARPERRRLVGRSYHDQTTIDVEVRWLTRPLRPDGVFGFVSDKNRTPGAGKQVWIEMP
jgi:hypothetical protein